VEEYPGIYSARGKSNDKVVIEISRIVPSVATTKTFY
jgi:hypothetical protein